MAVKYSFLALNQEWDIFAVRYRAQTEHVHNWHTQNQGCKGLCRFSSTPMCTPMLVRLSMNGLSYFVTVSDRSRSVSDGRWCLPGSAMRARDATTLITSLTSGPPTPSTTTNTIMPHQNMGWGSRILPSYLVG